MIISTEWRIRDIQNEFHNQYPYLKIEFFKDGSISGDTAGQLEKVNPLQPLCSLVQSNGIVDIDIDPGKKVSDLKLLFKKDFGFIVHIFRKSGPHWIETSLTEDWTLKQQNDEGKLFSEL